MPKRNIERIMLSVDGEEIAEITSCDLIVNNNDWQDYLEENGEPWSMEIEIPCEFIHIDETWLAAYMGRMYANEFRS